MSGPLISPIVACIMTGSFFTYLNLARMHSNDTQLMSKLFELEKDIKNINQILPILRLILKDELLNFIKYLYTKIFLY